MLLPILGFGQFGPYYPANAGCSPTLDYFDDVTQTPNTYLKFNLEYTSITGPQLIDGYDLQYPTDPWGANGWNLIIRKKDENGDIYPFNFIYTGNPVPPGQEYTIVYVNTPTQHYDYEFMFPYTNPYNGASFDYYKYFYETESIDIKALFPDHTSSDEYVITLATVRSNPMAWPPILDSCGDNDLPAIGIYMGVDTDGDGIFDLEDNCPDVSNADQSDVDGDGIGNVCDNCPDDANENQEDNDGDGLGDLCDDDDDNDGVLDVDDNCPTVANPDQADVDNDGVGDACADEDEDGVIDVEDNCPENANPDQADEDGDGVGDVCDNCEDTSNSDQADNDGDGLGNACDNCPDDSNSNQADLDGDGIGNVCDNDRDGDGIDNSSDNCPDNPNPDQADSDGDGLGDECDDTDDNALPNLRVSGFTVTVDGTTYDATNTNPIFKRGGEHVFNITFENIDEGLAEDVSFRLFVSTSPDAYPDVTSTPVQQYWNNFNDVGDISGNSEASFTFTDYIYEQISTIQLVENTPFYMFVHVDYDEDIEESGPGDSDNIAIVVFTWDDPDTAGRVANLNIGNGIIEVPLDNNSNNGGGLTVLNKKPIEPIFNLKVYNINNTISTLVNQNVQDGQTIDVSNLPAGTYVVHVNDNYVKKFRKSKKISLIKQ